MSLEFHELPGELRIKLEESSEEELWKKVEDIGISEVAEDLDVPRSRIYSWRSKDLFLPVWFVRNFIDSPEEAVLKSESRSSEIGLRFPIEENSELLTRVDRSVVLTSEGVPLYLADEKSLVERFQKLIKKLGEVPVSVYSRKNRFELRYPKALHLILDEMSFEEDLDAAVDESGIIENGKVKINGNSIPVEEFDGKLYSREKMLELALEREDSDKVEKLMREEVEKVRRAFE